VAPLFSNTSGTKLSPLFNSPYPLAQIASAINIVPVPSFLIFQEISGNRMSGQELHPKAPLIPPVTKFSVAVRDDLHDQPTEVAKLSYFNFDSGVILPID
jgi:hypothetical protein